MTGLDATIARALSGYNAGDVLSFDSLREAGVEPGTPLYFLCRSGVRSRAAAAAATSAGLGPAHNVLDGFEGGHDDDGHRSVSGWKNVGLPWRQG